jgi:hypothetical protein
MIDPVLGTALLSDATFLLAQSDPVVAMKVLAKALRRQTEGCKRAALRILADEMGITTGSGETHA